MDFVGYTIQGLTVEIEQRLNVCFIIGLHISAFIWNEFVPKDMKVYHVYQVRQTR